MPDSSGSAGGVYQARLGETEAPAAASSTAIDATLDLAVGGSAHYRLSVLAPGTVVDTDPANHTTVVFTAFFRRARALRKNAGR